MTSPPSNSSIPEAPSITAEESAYFKTRYTLFKKHTRYAGWSAAAASFLTIGALIVIVCASLCFTLPGVNAMQDIILPAYLPAGGALLLSIPFIILSIKNKRPANLYRKETINKMKQLLTHYDVAHLGKKKKINRRVEFIEKNFLPEQHQAQYYGKLLRELIKTYPKKEDERSHDQKKIVAALTQASKNLN